MFNYIVKLDTELDTIIVMTLFHIFKSFNVHILVLVKIEFTQKKIEF